MRFPTMEEQVCSYIFLNGVKEKDILQINVESFICAFIYSVSDILQNPIFTPLSLQLPPYRRCFTYACLSQQRVVTRQDQRTQDLSDFDEPDRFNQGQFPAQSDFENEIGTNNFCSYHGCIRKLRLKRRNLLNAVDLYQSKRMPGQATMNLPYQISSFYPDNDKRFSDINNNRFIRLI